VSARERLRVAAPWLGPAVSVAAVAAVLAWALRQPRPDLPTDGDALAAVAAALGLYALATVLRGERWRRIVARDGTDLAPTEALGLTLVGYMGNNTLPARAGDLMRAGLLSRRHRTGVRGALGTVVAERVLDAVALLVLLIAVAWTVPATADIPAAAVAAAVALLVLAAVAALLLVRAARRGGRVAALVSRLAPVARATGALRGRHALAMLAASLGIWLLEAGVFLFVAEAADVPLGPAAALYTMAVTNVVGLVPAGPGYVGTFEAAVILAATAAGGEGAAVVAFALLLRVVLFVPITLAGLAVLLARYGIAPLRGRAAVAAR